MKNILFCWIGNTDLAAMMKLGTDEQKKAAEDALKGDKKHINKDLLDNAESSSILLALEKSAAHDQNIPLFGKIILLTNRTHHPNGEGAEAFCTLYRDFLGGKFPAFCGKIDVRYVKAKAYEFQSVYNKSREVLEECRKNGDSPDGFWYNISPGTIAQQASWILHGKAMSTESHFLQGSKSRKTIEPCEIPFDITTALNTTAGQLGNDANSPKDIIGRSPSFQKIINQARTLAQFPVPVLLTGESGTGKEVIAKEIHRVSGRTGKFIAINCATLSKELGRSELTGYVKGAFTGAYEDRNGKLQDADEGTLFLDEVGECPLDFQAELLRILQPRDFTKPTICHFTPLGAKAKEKQVDVRIICATNRDLTDNKAFREDLYYRISAFQLKLPSLERRKAEKNAEEGINDVKDLADHFLSWSCRTFHNGRTKAFDDSAYEALQQHIWKGNVRELQNTVKRAAVFSMGDTITADDVNDCFGEDDSKKTTPEKAPTCIADVARQLAQIDLTPVGKSCDERIAEFRHHYFTAALEATGGNKKMAYTQLKVNPRTFDEYLKRE